jgi:hypothetical protein
MTEADTRANSGPLPAQVMVENIQVERSSRNVRIARFLNELGFIRELNEGVSRIFSSMEQSMLAKSEYRDTNSIVRLTLKNKVSKHRKTIHESILFKIEELWPALIEIPKDIVGLDPAHYRQDLTSLRKSIFDIQEGMDGVQRLKYTSSHLAEVDSEFVVPAWHNAQDSSKVQDEMIRILKLHLRE